MANDIPDQLFKRMVLTNQYRILALLDKDDQGFWDNAADMAARGWPVENLPGVDMIKDYAKDALTKEDQRFVLDAFNVFALLQDAEKAGLKPKGEHAWLEFPGFDGNNEGTLLTYARHIVRNENRFEYVRRANDDFNSHMPTVELYNRMIAEWDRQGRPQKLNEEQFDQLLMSQLHPSQRTA